MLAFKAKQGSLSFTCSKISTKKGRNKDKVERERSKIGLLEEKKIKMKHNRKMHKKFTLKKKRQSNKTTNSFLML